MSREMTNKEAIANLNHIYGIVSPDIQRSLDLAIKALEERPQGECKTCKHRDPEDKKCDCGGIERQGCPFPVSDDYYCKYYERGEEE